MKQYAFFSFLFLFTFNIYSTNITDSINVKNCVAFGKAFCYLKYFSPIKNYKKFDWDSYLVEGLKETAKTGSQKELKSKLTLFFSGMNPDIEFVYSSSINPISITQHTDSENLIYYFNYGCGMESKAVRWNKAPYSTTLWPVAKKTNSILYSLISERRPYQISDSIFLIFRTSTSKTVNFKPKSFPKIDKRVLKNSTDVYNRIATLIKCWGVFQHFYPYELDRKSLEIHLEEDIRKTIKEKDYKELYFTTKHFLSFINDGHVEYYLTAPRNWYSMTYKSQFIPKISTAIIDDKIIVTQVDTSLKSQIYKGDAITKINGLADSVFIKYKSQFISASTKGFRNYKVNEMLFKSMSKDSVVKIEIQRGNEKINTSLTCNTEWPNKQNYASTKPPFQMLHDSIAYLNLTDPKLTAKLVEKNLSLLNSSKGLIFDLRGYPNFNTDKILAMLIDSDVSTADFKIPNVNEPNYHDIYCVNSSWKIKANRKILNKKIIFLSDNTVVSWGETVLEIIKRNKIGTIIGEESAGTNGDLCQVDLPIGFIYITGLKVEVNGQNPLPVQPDLYCPSISIGDIVNGTDFLLMFAKKYIVNN